LRVFQQALRVIFFDTYPILNQRGFTAKAPNLPSTPRFFWVSWRSLQKLGELGGDDLNFKKAVHRNLISIV